MPTKKLVAIGDIHGSDKWKSAVDTPADIYVFIGDYFDTFEDVSPQEQYHNFEDIVEFQKSSPAEVVLLCGNHDMSYLGGSEARCSGYNPITATFVLNRLRELVRDRRLQMCYEYDGILFSHAGVTKTWVDEMLDGEFSAQNVNDCFYYTPRKFYFRLKEFSHNQYGDNAYQSPIWVRPRSLAQDKIDGYIQVVGHTMVKTIDVKLSLDVGIFVIDTFNSQHSNDEYLIYESGEFKSKKVI